MFRRIIQSVFGGKPSSSDSLGAASVPELTGICDAYWDSRAHPDLADGAGANYSQYVTACNELSKRGPGIAPWVLARIDHPACEAREQAAFLLGQLAGRSQLTPDELTTAIEKLGHLAIRPWQENTKELQANGAALTALGNAKDQRAVPVLQEIVLSPDWEEDDNSWEAACVLGRLVRQPFAEADNPLEAARAWIRAQGR